MWVMDIHCARHASVHAGKDVNKAAKEIGLKRNVLNGQKGRAYVAAALKNNVDRWEGQPDRLAESMTCLVDHLLDVEHDQLHCDYHLLDGGPDNIEGYAPRVPLQQQGASEATKLMERQVLRDGWTTKEGKFKPSWLAKYGNKKMCLRLSGNANTNIAEAVNAIILMFEAKRKFHPGAANNELASYLACGYANVGAQFFSMVAARLGIKHGAAFQKLVDSALKKQTYNTELNNTAAAKNLVTQCKIMRSTQTKDLEKADNAANGSGGSYGQESRHARQGAELSAVGQWASGCDDGCGGGAAAGGCNGAGTSAAPTPAALPAAAAAAAAGLAAGPTAGPAAGQVLDLSKNGVCGACTCSGMCFLRNGKSACPCKAASEFCSDVCKCGRKTGCKNNASGKATARTIPLAEFETPTAGGEYLGELNDFVELSALSGPIKPVGVDYEATGGVANKDELMEAGLQSMTLDLAARTLTVDSGPGSAWQSYAQVRAPHATRCSTRPTLSRQLSRCPRLQISGTVREWIEELTKISQHTLAGAPTQEQIVRLQLDQFKEMGGGRPMVIVGHNVIPFDYPLLYARACEARIDLYKELTDINVVGVLDTLWLARRVNWGPSPPQSMKLGVLHLHELQEELAGAHGAQQDATGDCKLLAAETLSAAVFADPDRVVVSLAQATNRARVFRHTQAAAQPERVKVEDLLATVDYWLERAADGARLKLDGLKAVSEQQGAFFRRKVHEHCKALVRSCWRPRARPSTRGPARQRAAML